MPLSDTAIRNAKPAEKHYKFPDEKGLFLLVNPNGSKYWRHIYRFNGKEKLLAHGIDPSENRKAQKAAWSERAENSFEVIIRVCFRGDWICQYRSMKYR